MNDPDARTRPGADPRSEPFTESFREFLSDPASTQISTPVSGPGPALDAPSSPDALRAWLRLSLSSGVGPVLARRAHALAETSAPIGSARWLARLRAGHPRLAERLDRRDPERDERVDQVLAWAAVPGQHLLTWADPGYPPRLADLDDAPPLVFARGDLSCLEAPGLAIVGSRHATTGGARHARAFAAQMAALGWVVVSGLARGIDAAAHEGALAAAGVRPGRTLAVLGNGLDRIYPAGNTDLAARILAQGGLILSELPPGSQPLRAHFPRRNRLIAALSQGVLVVEAARGSGSLITAQWALDLGREVFAIPGSIDAPQARGCHHLIRQGARLVESLADLLEELPPLASPLRSPLAAAAGHVPDSPPPTGPAAEASDRLRPGQGTQDTRNDHSQDGPHESMGDDDQALLESLGWDPFRVEALAEQAERPAAALGAGLLRLELAGELERLSDGRYQRLRPDG